MTTNRTVFSAVIVALTVAVSAPAFAQEETESDNPNAAAAMPPMPQVQLAPPVGFDDDASYLRSIADRVAELVDQAAQAVDPLARADRWLSSANLILAHELEAPCTGRLLRITADPHQLDEAELAARLDRVDRLIAQAEETIRQAPDQGEGQDGYRKELEQRQRTLEAFARALRAYLIPGEGPDAARSVRQAASRLSVLLEGGDPQVAAAAGLWQACLRSHESDLEPALTRLDLALADPPPQSLPYAFFGRLLRCRLLASRGSFAVALGLLIQMEDRCEAWMRTDADRANALRTVALLELQILSEWYAHLALGDHASERAWCAKQMDVLRTERFGADNKNVIRLTPAIPVLSSKFERR